MTIDAGNRRYGKTLHCKHSFKNLTLHTLLWGAVCFGLTYLFLMIGFLVGIRLDFVISSYVFAATTGLFLIFSLTASLFVLHSRQSVRLFFEEDQLSLVKKNKVQWKCKYEDITRARVVYVSGKYSTGSGYSEARLILANKKYLGIPWGLDHCNRSSMNRRKNDVYLPLQILAEKGVAVKYNKTIKAQRKIAAAAMPAVGLMLLLLAAVSGPIFYKMGTPSSLLHFDGKTTHTATPWQSLKALRFISIAAGTDGTIYVGTKSKGVYLFDTATKGFRQTELSPEEPARSLLFDAKEQKLWGIFRNGYGAEQKIFHLEKDGWKRFDNGAIKKKRIFKLGCDDIYLSVATDNGLYLFSRENLNSPPAIFLRGMETVDTFIHSKRRYVLTRHKTEKGTYLYSLLYESPEEKGDWPAVFSDKSIFNGMLFHDTEGELWAAKNARTLVHLAPAGTETTGAISTSHGAWTGPPYAIVDDHAPVFKKFLVGAKVYVGVAALVPQKGLVVSLYTFTPGERKAFTTLAAHLPAETMDFTLDAKGTPWSFRN
ncbi:MAG: hypothetical protein GY765_31735 [bacterium]|nr:hypothetical protein [bacterium]